MATRAVSGQQEGTSPAGSPQNDSSVELEESPEHTQLAQIDQEFQQVRCLGHGAFGSVFLAKKRSGRLVALKFMRFELDGDEEEEEEKFNRELDSVSQLDDDHASSSDENRALSIVFFEDWFTGPGFGCFVMKYADGGTLAQEIESKLDQDPYAERRIAWYALQLSSALAFAHERGVAHHDVKSSNVLIDRSDGGKLLLADFGSAVAPGEESVGFSEIYASPELQAAHARSDYSGLDVEKIDAFGLGCIMYEMLCCKKLVDLTDEQTLAEYINERQSVNAALDLPCLRLPWLPQPNRNNGTDGNSQRHIVGYSDALRNLVKLLLDPMPTERWAPSQIEKPLQEDPRSPLLADTVVAAKTALPGAPVTIDNVQLGMFVQSGPDWTPTETDSYQPENGSIGVVVRLDPDGGYTDVAFPPMSVLEVPKAICCRIGARNKYELRVGPESVAGSETRMANGIVLKGDANTNLSLGQTIYGCFVVVGVHERNNNMVFVAPKVKRVIPPIPVGIPNAPVHLARGVPPRKPIPPPDSWEMNNGVLVEVVDTNERELVLKPFHSIVGGMDTMACRVESIKRVQSAAMWKRYASQRERVAEQNWGIVNEKRLFLGTLTESPIPDLVYSISKYDELFSTTQGFFLVESSASSHQNAYLMPNNGGEIRQLVLSRVALGRVDEREINEPDVPPHELHYHSTCKRGANQSKIYSIRRPSQSFPEYVITYRVLSSSSRRIVRARRQPGQSPGGTVPTTNYFPGGAYGTRPRRSRNSNYRRQHHHTRVLSSPAGSPVNTIRERPTRRVPAVNRQSSLNSNTDDSAATDVAVAGRRQSQRVHQQQYSSNVQFEQRRVPNVEQQSATESNRSGSNRSNMGGHEHTIRNTRHRARIPQSSLASSQHTSPLLDSPRASRTVQRTPTHASSRRPAGGQVARSGRVSDEANTLVKEMDSLLVREKSPASKQASSSPSESSANTKMCVICWENPVSHILVPCGHPCLCQTCATSKTLKKLRYKCPECRGKIRESVKFYGRVVED